MKSKLFTALLILLLSAIYSHGQDACIGDSIPPLVITQANITTSNDSGQCFAVISITSLYPFLVYDECGINSLTPNGIPTDYEFPIGTTTVTWTASDNAGNIGTEIQTVTVIDTENPVINCPSDIIRSCKAGNG